MTDDEMTRLFEAATDRFEKRMDERVTEIRGHFDIATERFEKRLDDAAERFEKRMDERVTEIRHHFDVTAEGMRHEIGLIVEKMTRIDEKLDQRTADIE